MVITPVLVLSFVIIFILAWLFIKTIETNKWLLLLLSTLATPLLYFYLFYPIFNIFSSYHHQKYFNAENWKANPELRFEMMDQLNNNNQLIGKTKADIESDFGPAGWYGWDDRIKANSKDQWNYNMGFKPGAFNKQQECIEITFKNDTVVTLKTYQLEKKFE
jgi:hypothetical protein